MEAYVFVAVVGALCALKLYGTLLAQRAIDALPADERKRVLGAMRRGEC